jgi:hypothetical protein
VKVTVLWEDQRPANAKRFGPHELLVACLADEIAQARDTLSPRIISVPMKGNGNVLRAIQQNLGRLGEAGPVCAVFDRDKIRDLVGGGSAPLCMSGIKRLILAEVPGEVELLLLDQNIESLVNACCRVAGVEAPIAKPRPDLRDRVLGRTAWSTSGERAKVRAAVPSFERLVRWVARQLNEVPTTSPGGSHSGK